MREMSLYRSFLYSAVFIAVVGLVFALSAAGFYVRLFKLIGVPAMPPIFGDMRDLTSALDVWRAGGDPLIANPIDPWKRAIDHPRVWHVLGWLGIGYKDSLAVGIVAVCLFAASIVLILQLVAKTDKERRWILAVTLSPVAFLLMERGNTDCVVFAFVALAILTVAKMPRVAWLSIAAAFTLKIFPIFAMSVFATRNRKVLAAASALSIVLVVVVVYFMWHDIPLFYKNKEHTSGFSYGREVLVILFTHYTPWQNQLLPDAIVIAVFIAAFAFGWRRGPLGAPAADQLELTAFLAGSSIFVGTFLLTTNYDYRLLFCVFCVPMLVRVGESAKDKWDRTMARAALWAMAGATWFMLLRSSLISSAVPSLNQTVLSRGATVLSRGAEFVGFVSNITLFLLVTAILAMALRESYERLLVSSGTPAAQSL
jgi:hypothetical protein